jgi:putative DNA primase/helicase
VSTLNKSRKGLIAKDDFVHYNQSVAHLYAPHDGFIDAMNRAGLISNIHIIADSEIHRFTPEGERRPNAWYVFFGEGGAFGNWRTGLRQTWFHHYAFRTDRAAIEAKVKAAQHRMRKKTDKRHRHAAMVAARRWKAAVDVVEHPYLIAKAVISHGLKIEDDHLLVPVCHERRIWSLQTISKDGVKRFLSGGRISGGYFPIGSLSQRLWIAEGYATAATVHEVTGDAVVCAFNASNLPKVAEYARARFRSQDIFMAADHDEAGINFALEAMRKHALEGAIWPELEKHDWNDYCITYGHRKTLLALTQGHRG